LVITLFVFLQTIHSNGLIHSQRSHPLWALIDQFVIAGAATRHQ
jgi:hypothetical protein